MKVTGFQPAVNPQPIGNVQQVASKDLTAYGGNQFGMAMMNKTLSDAQKVAEVQIEDKMATDVTNATNLYSKRLSDLDNELRQNKLGNADGLTKRFEDEERKIRAEVIKGVPGYGKAQTAFNSVANRYSQSYYRNVADFQADQLEKNKDFVVSNGIVEAEKRALLNLNPDSLAAELKNTDSLVLANYMNRGMDFVKTQSSKARSTMVYNAISSASGTGSNQLARQLLDDYKMELSGEQYKALSSTMYQREKIDVNLNLAQKAIAAGVTTKAGFIDFAKREGTIGNVGGSILDIPAEDDIDMNIQGKLKAAIPSIGGLLDGMGIGKGARITSGYRDQERNRAANGAENSYHLKGDALDIVLPKNLSDAEMAKLKEKFGAHFSEVLFHDAGSGNHLHLGGYKGSLGNSSGQRPLSNTELEDAASTWEQMVGANKRDEERVKGQYLEQVLTAAHNIWQNNPNDIAAYSQLAKNFSGNPKYFAETNRIINYFMSVAPSNRQKSDTATLVELEDMDAKGTLTHDAVMAKANAGLLTASHVVEYSGKASRLTKGAEKTQNEQIDDQWKAIIDSTMTIPAERSLLKVEIKAQVDAKNLSGDERRAEAKKLIENKNEAKTYTERNSQKYNELRLVYGGELIDAIQKGNVGRNGMVDNAQVERIAAVIGRELDKDPVANIAVKEIISRGIPITQETYSAFYERAYEVQHGTKAPHRDIFQSSFNQSLIKQNQGV